MALSLELEIPPSVAPGEGVNVIVVATTTEARACAKIVVRLVGDASFNEEASTICEQAGVHEVGTLAAGTTRFETTLRIPEDAPPTFDKRARVAYLVSAEADLPWSRDVRVETELRVRHRPPDEITKGMIKGRARASGKRLAEPVPTMLVRVHKEVEAGQALRGTIELHAAAERVEKITTVVRGSLQDGSIVEETRPVAMVPGTRGSFTDGLKYELSIPITAVAPVTRRWHAPSFTAKAVSLTHEVKVIAIRKQLPDLVVTLPIRIHGRSRASRENYVIAGALRGQAARLATWQAVLAAIDTAKDAPSTNEEATRFELARGTALTRITGEVTREHGPRLRAELRWDSLGVGLRIKDAAAATFDGMQLRGELGDRCRVSVRTALQAGALLSEPLQRTLASFAAVDLHDRGGVVESAGSLQSKADLGDFVRRCLALQRSIRIRRKEIPLHASAFPLRAAYAAFAGRRRAALAPGDLSVDKSEPGAIGWSLRLRFAEDLLVGTDVFTDIAEGLELQTSAHEIAAKRLGQSVERSGRNLRMSLPLAADPASVESLLDAFVEATRTLTRGGSRGPYR